MVQPFNLSAEQRSMQLLREGSKALSAMSQLPSHIDSSMPSGSLPETEVKVTAVEATPRVFGSDNHTQGECPKAILMTRELNSIRQMQIEDLLVDRGINFDLEDWADSHWFCVDDFDDLELETTPPDIVLRHGLQKDGSMVPLKGKGLYFSEAGTGEWKNCLVHAYNHPYFSVEWAEDSAANVAVFKEMDDIGVHLFTLPRLMVLLSGENPMKFADRIQAAFTALRRAEVRTKFSFWIDSMPTDDVECLDVHQMERIKRLARNSVDLQDESLDDLYKELAFEVNLDFARFVNRMCFLSGLREFWHTWTNRALEVPESQRSSAHGDAEEDSEESESEGGLSEGGLEHTPAVRTIYNEASFTHEQRSAKRTTSSGQQAPAKAAEGPRASQQAPVQEPAKRRQSGAGGSGGGRKASYGTMVSGSAFPENDHDGSEDASLGGDSDPGVALDALEKVPGRRAAIRLAVAYKGESRSWEELCPINDQDIANYEEDIALSNLCAKPAPANALVPMPNYSFSARFSSFCYASLLITPSIVPTLRAVMVECQWLQTQCLFDTAWSKTLKMDQFMLLEKNFITKAAHNMKEVWVTNLHRIVSKNFEEVTKGWFSIHEKIPETYRLGKMQKLLIVVRLMVQDAIQSYTWSSATKYCEAVEQHLPDFVSVQDVHLTTSLFGEAAFAAMEAAKQEAAVAAVEAAAAEEAIAASEVGESQEDEQDFEASLNAFFTQEEDLLESSSSEEFDGARQTEFEVPAVQTNKRASAASTRGGSSRRASRRMSRCTSTGRRMSTQNRRVSTASQSSRLGRKDPGRGMFGMELKPSEDGQHICLTTDGDQLQAACMDVLEIGIRSARDVPKIEPAVMPQLHGTMSSSQHFSPLDEHSEFLEGRRARLAVVFQRSTPSLKAYMSLWAKYEPLLQLDPTEYVNDFDEDGPSPFEVEKDILSRRRMEQEVRNAIPDTIRVGMFEIDCQDMREMLMSQHRKVAALEEELLLRRFRALSADIVATYRSHFAHMRRSPKNIEEVVAMRKYIEHVRSEQRVSQARIDRCIDIYDLLVERLQVAAPAGDAIQRWYVFGLPGEACHLCVQIENRIDILEVKYLEEFQADQVEFKHDLDELKSIVVGFVKHADADRTDDICQQVEVVNERFERVSAQAMLAISRERLFRIHNSGCDKIVASMQKDWEPFAQLWTTMQLWRSKWHCWLDGDIDKIDPQEFESGIMDGLRTMAKVVTKLEDKRDAAQVLKLTKDLQGKLQSLKPYVPVVVGLRNKGMCERHWKQVSDLIGTQIGPDLEGLTLQGFDALGILKHAEAIAEIGHASGQELAIKTKLEDMHTLWKSVIFDVKVPYHNTGTYVLRNPDRILDILDEQVWAVQGLQRSPFKEPFDDDIEWWARSLACVSECLDGWLAVQELWMRLQPVFNSHDIGTILPVEAKKFKTIDDKWRQILGRTHHTPNVLQTCSHQGLVETWQSALTALEATYRSLTDYLNSKRDNFPRLYLLSYTELLDLLSSASDGDCAYQPFLRRIFEPVETFSFNDAGCITCLRTAAGEAFPLDEPVRTSEVQVEDWMSDLELQILESVRQAVKGSMDTFDMAQVAQFALDRPQQFVLLVSAVHFWTHMESAMQRGRLDSFLKAFRPRIRSIVDLLRDTEISAVQRLTVTALLISMEHLKDVMEMLINEGVDATSAFHWLCQPRHAFVADDDAVSDCWLHILHSELPHGNEYTGNSSRLVTTPLTDLCYLTLFSGFRSCHGGLLHSSVCTGKTAAVMDVANLLSKQCIVHACLPDVEGHKVGSLLKAIASSGLWVCLDEFNKLHSQALSIASQIISTLFQVRQGMKQFSVEKEIELESSYILVKATFNVFLTVSPSYAPVGDLPHSLHAIFRPVALVTQSFNRIAEVLMQACGFDNFQDLASRLVRAFSFSADQLPDRAHCDYGLHNLQRVIRNAGLARQRHAKALAEAAAAGEGHERPEPMERMEGKLVAQALAEAMMSKLSKEHHQVFKDLMQDAFAGVEVGLPETSNAGLRQPIEEQAVSCGLQPTKTFVGKCVQLCRALDSWHGCILLGCASSGKTSCMETVRRCSGDALLSPGGGPAPPAGGIPTAPCAVILEALNPKAVTCGQLFGYIDELSGEWRDGVAAAILRKASRGTHERQGQHWVMFDGPMDSNWTDCLSSVLDDSKRLCLGSGEIVPVTSAMRILFEVDEVHSASPAMIARCGVVFFESEPLGVLPIAQSYLQKLPHAINGHSGNFELMRVLCEELLPCTLQFLRQRLTEVLTTSDWSLGFSVFRLLDCYLKRYADREGAPLEAEDDLDDLCPVLGPIFIFCLVWSLGVCCDSTSRALFSDYMWATVSRAIAERMQIDMPSDATYSLPPELDDIVHFTGIKVGQLFYEYYFDMPERKWVLWQHTLRSFRVYPQERFEDIYVPTLESARLTGVLATLVLGDVHVLCPGPSGSGKRSSINHWLGHRVPDFVKILSTSCSRRTSAGALQDLVDPRLGKRRKGAFGPPQGMALVFFLDDMSMPAREACGAQPPLELLRQWLSHGGWYDRKHLTKRLVEGVVLLGSMLLGPGGEGWTASPRLTRHCNILYHAALQETCITSIFKGLAPNFLHSSVVPKLLTAMLAIHEKVHAEFLPVPAKCHYVFHLRDMWRLMLGVCSLNPDKGADNAEITIKCWVHEALRVYGDRLLDHKETQWLIKQLDDHLHTTFQVEMPPQHSVRPQQLCFTYFMAHDVKHRIYEEASDTMAVRERVQESLDDYNSVYTTAKLQMMMFKETFEITIRLCRLLGQVSGHAMLLANGKSGRHSMTRLACFICDVECMQTRPSGSGTHQFIDDLRQCLHRCCNKGQGQTLLFSDAHLTSDEAFEPLECVFQNGGLPYFFTHDDVSLVMSAARAACTVKGFAPTTENLVNEYRHKVRRYLHIVLVLSPEPRSLRERMRSFPAFAAHASPIWVQPWSDEALHGIAEEHLRNIEDDPGIMDYIAKVAPGIHRAVEAAAHYLAEEAKRPVHITVVFFLSFLAVFTSSLELKRGELADKQRNFRGCIRKFDEMGRLLKKIADKIEDMRPDLDLTQEKAAQSMEFLQRERGKLNDLRHEAAVEEEKYQVKAARAKHIKEDIANVLEVVATDLEAALQTLRKTRADLFREMKAATPPPSIKLTMEAVSILLGLKPGKKADMSGKKVDDYWDVAQKELLSDPKKLVDRCADLDKDNLPDRMMNTVASYTEREELDPSVLRKASQACEALYMWVAAICQYHAKAKTVRPKREELVEAQQDEEEQRDRYEEKDCRVRDETEELQGLEKRHKDILDKYSSQQTELEHCKTRLQRATQLTEALTARRSSWEDQVQAIKLREALLSSDCFLAAAYITYLGNFSAEVRSRFRSEWPTHLDRALLKHSSNTNLVSLLDYGAQKRRWLVQGLPNDPLFVESAIIMEKCRRWPLLIDPQHLGNRFIRHVSQELDRAALLVCRPGDTSTLIQTVEQAMVAGRAVLVENVGETLDPALWPVLLRQNAQGQLPDTVQLPSKTLTVAAGFRLFLTTSLAEPNFSADTVSMVNVINFTITQTALDEQLMSIIVSAERPEQEEEKQSMGDQAVRTSQQLLAAESQMLKLLDTSEDILEDPNIVEHINRSSHVIDSTLKKEKALAAAEVELNRSREDFRFLAQHASSLFFCLPSLTRIDPLYAFSLQWHINLLCKTLERTPKVFDVAERLTSLRDAFTEAICHGVGHALKEQDKLFFAFSVCVRLLVSARKMEEAELSFLLVGPIADLTEGAMRIPKEALWIGKRRWNEVLNLAQTVPAFKNMDRTFHRIANEWRMIVDSPTPETEMMPLDWQHKVTAFNRLCVIRALRMDRLKYAIHDFVLGEIDRRCIELPAFDLTRHFAEASSSAPLLLLLQKGGADPVPEIFDFADRMGASRTFEVLAMGRGQGARADALISTAKAFGRWVLLADCHAADQEWLQSTEALWEELHNENVNHAFRLWLTALPCKGFPLQVLHACVKMTKAVPAGIRANLLQVYSTVAERLPMDTPKPDLLRQLLFGLCFFHAVALERQRFGPAGWTGNCQFRSEDAAIASEQIAYWLKQYDSVPYSALRLLASNTYAGRMTERRDKSLLSELLLMYINEEAVTSHETYSYSESGIYHPPFDSTYKAHLEFIRGLPAQEEEAEVFGMSDGFCAVRATDEAQALLGSMRSLVRPQPPRMVQSRTPTSPTASSPLSPTPSSFATPVPVRSRSAAAAPDDPVEWAAANYLERLPSRFSMRVVKDRFPVTYYNSANLILHQECHQCNLVLAQVSATLEVLRRAVKGLAPFSSDLEDQAAKIRAGEVPAQWVASAPGPASKRLATWYSNVLAKCALWQGWLDIGEPPPCYHLPELFFPRALFLNVRQSFSRLRGLPLESVDLEYQVMDEVSDPKKTLKVAPDVGTYVWGIFLEGARWQRAQPPVAPSALSGALSAASPGPGHAAGRASLTSSPRGSVTGVPPVDAAAATSGSPNAPVPAAEPPQGLEVANPKEQFVELPPFHLIPKEGHEAAANTYMCPLYKALSRRGIVSSFGYDENHVAVLELRSPHEPTKWLKAGVAAFLFIES